MVRRVYQNQDIFRFLNNGVCLRSLKRAFAEYLPSGMCFAAFERRLGPAAIVNSYTPNCLAIQSPVSGRNL
jgi:hypothetical protein